MGLNFRPIRISQRVHVGWIARFAVSMRFRMSWHSHDVCMQTLRFVQMDTNGWFVEGNWTWTYLDQSCMFLALVDPFYCCGEPNPRIYPKCDGTAIWKKKKVQLCFWVYQVYALTQYLNPHQKPQEHVKRGSAGVTADGMSCVQRHGCSPSFPGLMAMPQPWRSAVNKSRRSPRHWWAMRKADFSREKTGVERCLEMLKDVERCWNANGGQFECCMILHDSNHLGCWIGELTIEKWQKDVWDRTFF